MKSQLKQRLLAVSFFAGVCAQLNAQSYTIDWHTIDGGGGSSTGGVYAVSGTIGQPDAGGPMTNGLYSVTGGFWALFGVQMSGAPTLTITPAAPGFAILSWPVTALNFQLQETTNLALPNSWSPVAQPAVTNGAQISVTVPASADRKFFRLKWQ